MRKDYVRFVELVNQGAKEMGFADAGEVWRAGYDMPPAQIAAETDRLWGQVKPLYEQLHCYTRTRLAATYGVERSQVGNGLLPAYRDPGSLDITGALEAAYRQDYTAQLAEHAGTPTPSEIVDYERGAQLESALRMTRRAEDFYVSLGMPKLPPSYWEKTQF